MSSSTEIIETNTGINKNDSSVASRKLAAAEFRKARKAARDPRSRLLSDSSDENYQVPRGILKNSRIPTKRSVSECVDDLSQIMADLDLNIHDLPKATGKFCLHHQYFDEHEEEFNNNVNDNLNENKKIKNSLYGSKKNVTKCDCNSNSDRNNKEKSKKGLNFSGDENSRRSGEEDEEGDFDYDNDDEEEEEDDEGEEKPKKSVRFDEKVYETVFFASRLYDRRSFAKYHFSTRHHPKNNQKQNNNNNNKSNNNKKGRQRSKSESDGDLHRSFASLKSDSNCTGSNGCKLSKSQRAKQSKKDKKKRLNNNNNNNNRKDDVIDTNSDDQGYHSHSFSD